VDDLNISDADESKNEPQIGFLHIVGMILLQHFPPTPYLQR
jgi:hypothetical protein